MWGDSGEPHAVSSTVGSSLPIPEPRYQPLTRGFFVQFAPAVAGQGIFPDILIQLSIWCWARCGSLAEGGFMFSIFRKPAWPEIPLEDIKKRTRLLVIDDAEFPYQELFKRDGYTIERWADVLDLPKLEAGAYDIILLDLQGVGRQQSAEQGLGILRHLRQVSPSQIIIAYSSADWPLKYQEFFRLADEVLAKSSDYVDFKRKVDDLLKQRFSLGFYVNRVRTLVAEHLQGSDQLDRVVRRSIQDRSPEKLQKYLQGKITDPQVINAAANVVRTAIAAWSLWKS